MGKATVQTRPVNQSAFRSTLFVKRDHGAVTRSRYESRSSYYTAAAEAAEAGRDGDTGVVPNPEVRGYEHE